MDILKTTVGRTFQSTNFTLQSLIPLATAVLLLLGVPEELSTQLITFTLATITTGVGFWGTVREYFKGAIGFTWSSNVLTYLVAFLTGLFPFLAEYDVVPAIESLIAGISSGDFSLIFAAFFTVGNIVYQIVRSQKKD